MERKCLDRQNNKVLVQIQYHDEIIISEMINLFGLHKSYTGARFKK